MSWDISITKFSRIFHSIEEIPANEQALNLGSCQSVHKAVLEIFPNTNWSDPAWGIWDTPFGSVDFNLGADDPAKGMMLHVRASDEIIPLIVRLCLNNGWQGIDVSAGNFIEQAEEPEKGLKSWANYRNQVVRDPSDNL